MFNKLKNLIEKICKKRVWVNPQLLCEYMYNHNAFDNKNEFVNITESKFERKADDTKLIAFYLPQYHAVEVNDKSYGKGFTDWLNTSKTLPQFVGHNQPHLPYDVGFYDLSHDDVMYRQIELAKMYGLYGFCFHYYWFSGGKRLAFAPEAICRLSISPLNFLLP